MKKKSNFDQQGKVDVIPSKKEWEVVIMHENSQPITGEVIKCELGHHFSSLFRPLRRKKQRQKGRIVKWQWKVKEQELEKIKYDELEYEFRCFEELGEDDLKVFLRLVQITDIGHVVLDPYIEEYETPEGKLIRQLSVFSDNKEKLTKKDAKLLPVVRSRKTVSYNAFFGPLLRGRVNNSNGIGKKNLLHFKECLQRLASTTVFIEAKRKGKVVKSFGSSLISYVMEVETGRFFVAVNPFIARAILGSPLGGYRPLIDASILTLKGTAAVLLSWLSAWIQPGHKKSISIEKLEEHIYAEKTTNKKVRYWRYRQLKNSLQKIAQLKHWNVTEIKKNVFEIERKKIQQVNIDLSIELTKAKQDSLSEETSEIEKVSELKTSKKKLESANQLKPAKAKDTGIYSDNKWIEEIIKQWEKVFGVSFPYPKPQSKEIKAADYMLYLRSEGKLNKVIYNPQGYLAKIANDNRMNENKFPDYKRRLEEIQKRQEEYEKKLKLARDKRLFELKIETEVEKEAQKQAEKIWEEKSPEEKQEFIKNCVGIGQVLFGKDFDKVAEEKAIFQIMKEIKKRMLKERLKKLAQAIG